MKKTFLKGAAVLFLAVAFVLTGCQEATVLSNTTENTILSLGGPSNLTADVANEGGVILTWDIDSNASDYEVWRQKAGGSFKKLINLPTTGLAEGKYADVISSTNVLENATQYTYKVVAVSANSTARAVTIVQNGEANYTVTTGAAQFPAAGTASVVSAVSGVTVTVDNALGNAHITWINPNTNPLVRLVVSGNRNGSSFGPYTVSAGAEFYDVSLAGYTTGTINVGVRAVFANNNGTTSTYYPASAVEYKDAVYDIPALGSITASIYYAARQSNSTQVVILFDDNPTAPGATYTLEKAVVVSNTSARVWTGVSTAGKIKNIGYWQVTDTVALDEKVEYRLTVQTVAGISKVSQITDYDSDYDSTVYVATVGSSIVGYTLTPKDVTTTPKVEITWTARPGYDYELARSALTFGANANYTNALGSPSVVPVAIGAPATIALTPADYVAGQGVKLDSGVAAGTAYQYTLTEKTSPGGIVTNVHTQRVASYTFSNFSYLGVSVAKGQGYASEKHGQLRLTITDSSGAYFLSGDTIEVYRRKWGNSDPINTSYEVAPVATLDYGTDFTASQTTIYWTDDAAPLTQGDYYQYKAVLKRGGNELVNTGSNESNYNVTPSTFNISGGAVYTSATASEVTYRLSGNYFDGKSVHVVITRAGNSVINTDIAITFIGVGGNNYGRVVIPGNYSTVGTYNVTITPATPADGATGTYSTSFVR
jgi:hypothetical protein